jgi:hypothetical protein
MLLNRASQSYDTHYRHDSSKSTQRIMVTRALLGIKAAEAQYFASYRSTRIAHAFPESESNLVTTARDDKIVFLDCGSALEPHLLPRPAVFARQFHIAAYEKRAAWGDGRIFGVMRVKYRVLQSPFVALNV